MLALSLSLPVPLAPLNRIAVNPDLVDRAGGTVWARAHAAKPLLKDKVTALTGALVSRVDVRITGVRSEEGRRVR